MIELVGVPLNGWGDGVTVECRWLFPLESVRSVKWLEGTLEVDSSAFNSPLKTLDKDAALYGQLRARLGRGGY